MDNRQGVITALTKRICKECIEEKIAKAKEKLFNISPLDVNQWNLGHSVLKMYEKSLREVDKMVAYDAEN